VVDLFGFSRCWLPKT